MIETEELTKRWGALKLERSTWFSHWSELSRYMLPVNGRFFMTDRNKGYKRYNQIYDNTGCDAVNVLAAGMMSGMTSPSRPWFSLTLADKDLMQYQPVSIWLEDVKDQINQVFAKSNLYRVLHGMYEELSVFGTASSLIADDFKDVIHLHPFTIGEYAIQTDWRGDVVTLYREFQRSVGATVKEFGYENCSNTIQSLYDRGTLDAWVQIIHAIEPRVDRDIRLKDSKNMPWKSCYFESGNNQKYLRESGFKTFPCISPRWKTVGGDVYGVSPGMYALGDVKSLQSQEFRKLQAIDYKANPPVQIPSSMKNREVELFPGGQSYYDASSGTQGIKTAFEVNLDIRELIMAQQDVRHRINSAFYKDIFMMISSQPADGRMTATEITARNEEKMLMLGPVVERLSNEMLSPLVETVFDRLLSAGMLPNPPEELQGHDLGIEYTSVLAQAQRAVSINGVDRFVASLGQMAQIKPEVLDKLDSDKWADEMADKLGINPEMIVAGEQVTMIRQQRAQAQQQAQKMESLKQGSEMIRNVGGVPTDDNSMAGALMQRAQG